MIKKTKNNRRKMRKTFRRKGRKTFRRKGRKTFRGGAPEVIRTKQEFEKAKKWATTWEVTKKSDGSVVFQKDANDGGASMAMEYVGNPDYEVSAL